MSLKISLQQLEYMPYKSFRRFSNKFWKRWRNKWLRRTPKDEIPPVKKYTSWRY